MMSSKQFRPAIAMIELIFALVVMGIAVMSAPMLIATASSSTSVALQQEGINEAASRINMILTYPWDQNDITDSCIPPVLHVTHGNPALNEVATTGRRIGVPLQTDAHTFKCDDREFNASPIGIEGAVANDIDDFNNPGQLLTLAAGGVGGKDYIERATVQMRTVISYDSENIVQSYNVLTLNYQPSFAVSAGTSNVKDIVVRLTSTSGVDELQKTIILRAFSCNVGGIAYESRGI